MVYYITAAGKKSCLCLISVIHVHVVILLVLLQGESVEDYQYIDVWSSPSTWLDGLLPVEGDLIVVPEEETLLIDIDTPVIKMLLINGTYSSHQNATHQ